MVNINRQLVGSVYTVLEAESTTMRSLSSATSPENIAHPCTRLLYQRVSRFMIPLMYSSAVRSTVSNS
jgi:hypothetical protein